MYNCTVKYCTDSQSGTDGVLEFSSLKSDLTEGSGRAGGRGSFFREILRLNTDLFVFSELPAVEGRKRGREGKNKASKHTRETLSCAGGGRGTPS